MLVIVLDLSNRYSIISPEQRPFLFSKMPTSLIYSVIILAGSGVGIAADHTSDAAPIPSQTSMLSVSVSLDDTLGIESSVPSMTLFASDEGSNTLLSLSDDILSLSEELSIFSRSEEGVSSLPTEGDIASLLLERDELASFENNATLVYASRPIAQPLVDLEPYLGTSEAVEAHVTSMAEVAYPVIDVEHDFLSDAASLGLSGDDEGDRQEEEVAQVNVAPVASFSSTVVTPISSAASSSSVASISGAGGGAASSYSTRSGGPIVMEAVQTTFPVVGIHYITAEDNLFMNASAFTQDLIYTIQGTDKLEGGVVEESALDGAGRYSGFELYYRSYGTRKTTIVLDGIKHFQNFNHVNGSAAGGAIALFNGGDIVFSQEEGEMVTFRNNRVEGTTGHASGGALFITGGGSVTDLNANFLSNSAIVDQDSGETRYARGGAIFVGDYDSVLDGYVSSDVISSIGNITGRFENNSAAFGGAIYVAQYGDIGHVSGDFINNLAEGEKQATHTQGASGGAIRTWQGSIGSIDGNFTGNVAHALTGMAVGGAVSLDGTEVKGGITGHYDGNIAFADSGIAQGGAYVLKNQNGDEPIIFTNTDFTNNVAGTGLSSLSSAQGGALYVEKSADIFIVADGEDVLISNNYVVNNATWDADNRQIVESTSSVRDYTAFYVKDSAVTLQTTEGKDNTITINDAIRDDNSATTVSEIIIQDLSTQRYGVKLNGEIGVDHLIVESGGVELGSFTHSNGDITTATFTNDSNLTVHAGAVVKTNADYLKNVGEVDLRGTAGAAGTIELTGGTLVSDINGVDKVHTGHIDIIGETTVSGGATIYADNINVHDTLVLTDAASVDVETLLFSGYGKDDVNGGGNQIIASSLTTFAFDMIELNFATANPGDIFELIVAAEGETVDIDFDFSSIVFTVDGKELVEGADEDYIIRRRADGGVEVEILIHVPPPVPEPSAVMLGLISLGAALSRRRRKAHE